MARKTRKKSAAPKKQARRKATKGKSRNRAATAKKKPARIIDAASLPFDEQVELAALELDAGRSGGIARFLTRYESDYPFASGELAAAYDRALAEAHAHDGSLVEAERVAARGIETNPDDLDLYYILCFTKLGMREFEQSLQYGREYLARLKGTGESARRERDESRFESQNSQIHNFIGSDLFELERWDDALEAFEAAIACDPGNYLPYVNMEKVHRRRRNFNEARQIVKQGLQNARRVDELRMIEKELSSRVSISACLMVKNEEEMLPDCLESIRDFVDEIIVVDTGSTDRTVEIAESFGAKIYHQPWEGNFSKHRNYTIDLASSEWVFIIDADERLYDGDAEKLKPYLTNPDCDIISVSVINHYKLHGGMTTHLPSVRIFRKSYGLRYEGIVHNQIPLTPDDKVYHTAARIKHLGYDLTPEKMRNKFERTRALLEDQLADNPDDPFALFNYAQLLQVDERGRYQKANVATILESASRAVELTDPQDKKQRPIHLMCLNQMGWAYFHDGQFSKSLESCDKAISHKPDYLDVLLLRGMVLTSMNRCDDAAKAYNEYLRVQSKFDPAADRDQLMLSHSDNRPAALYGLAEIALKNNDRETAKGYFEEILQQRRAFLNTGTRLAEINIADGDLVEARRNYILQLRYGTNIMLGDLIGLAGVYRRARRTNKAVHYYRRIIERADLEPRLKLETARYFHEMGYHGDAYAVLSGLTDDFSGQQAFWRDLADVALKVGKPDEAITAYKRVIELDGDSAVIASNLANCHFNMKQYDEALYYYKKALELDGTPLETWRNIGLTMARMGQIEASIEHLTTFLEKQNRPEPDILHVLGDLYGRQGRFRDALGCYERCLRENPLNPEALHNISECYLHLGHVESAMVGYRQALKINPHFTPARQRLSQLEQAASGQPV